MTSAQALPFGKLLKRIRLSQVDKDGKPQPWTQYELARESKVAESEICQLERCKRSPQDGTRMKLAAALKAPQLMPPDLA